jgi:hypothetical protein
MEGCWVVSISSNTDFRLSWGERGSCSHSRMHGVVMIKYCHVPKVQRLWNGTLFAFWNVYVSGKLAAGDVLSPAFWVLLLGCWPARPLPWCQYQQ